MDSAIVFIGLVIAGITEAIRLEVPKVNGAVTIAAAALIGLLVAALDVQLGLPNITLAQGISAGLAASGTVAIAKRVG
jgi:hypothetical protein